MTQRDDYGRLGYEVGFLTGGGDGGGHCGQTAARRESASCVASVTVSRSAYVLLPVVAASVLLRLRASWMTAKSLSLIVWGIVLVVGLGGCDRLPEARQRTERLNTADRESGRLVALDSLDAALTVIDSALVRDGDPGRWASEGDTLAAYLSMRAGYIHWARGERELALRAYGRAWLARTLPDSLQVESVRQAAYTLTDDDLGALDAAGREGALRLLDEADAVARTTGDGTLIARVHRCIAALVDGDSLARQSRAEPQPPKRKGVFVVLFVLLTGAGMFAAFRVRALKQVGVLSHEATPK